MAGLSRKEEAILLATSTDGPTLKPTSTNLSSSQDKIMAVDTQAKNPAPKASMKKVPAANEAATMSSTTQVPVQPSFSGLTNQPFSASAYDFLDELIDCERLRKFDATFKRDLKRLVLSKPYDSPKPYNTPKPNASTTLLDLPFDIIRDICDHVVYLYPPAPSDCTKGTTQNPVTGEEEIRLELNSTAFREVIHYLNGGPAQKDLESISLTCKRLNDFMKKSMDSIHKTLLRQQPLRVEAIWFEDLSYLLAELNIYGLSKMSTLTMYWDPRPRDVGTVHAPEVHRSDAAGPRTFDILAYKCKNLRTVSITIAPELLMTVHSTGWPRRKLYGSYFEINGMAELRTLIRSVRGRGGHVSIRLALDDFGGDREKKKALLQWLEEETVI